MITDASNLERDQMNSMAQEHRIAAGELGAHQVDLPGKPYSLHAGDEIIFSAKYRIPGQQAIKNGITGTIIDTSRDEQRVTIRTNEHEPREIEIDTTKFDELSLSYAVHVNKAQGITAETSGILIGGWQTHRENAYVTVSHAREETKIYISREDLGEMGLDVGAVERLGDKMRHSRAQEASITKKVAERSQQRQHTRERQHATERTGEPEIDDDIRHEREHIHDPVRERIEHATHDRYTTYEQTPDIAIETRDL
jgi:ATP-dependent exoDNAse (exonuclease V) alpha subunit